MLSSPARFVADTHTLWWYLWSRDRLTPAASAVFRLAETGGATIVVPAIVVTELYFLSVKIGRRMTPSQILEALDRVGGITTSDLGRAQLERLDRLPEIPEMHDRLIAAESMALDAPLMTRDAVLAASSQIETVW